jgi:hypothetical protein
MMRPGHSNWAAQAQQQQLRQQQLAGAWFLQQKRKAAASRVCKTCGARPAPDADFCEHCGAALPPVVVRVPGGRLLQIVVAVVVAAVVVFLIVPGVSDVSNRIRSLPIHRTPLATAVPVTVTSWVIDPESTDNLGANLRQRPDLNARNDPTFSYPPGTRLEQIGNDDRDSSNNLFHHVRAPDGKEGWVPAKFVLPG